MAKPSRSARTKEPSSPGAKGPGRKSPCCRRRHRSSPTDRKPRLCDDAGTGLVAGRRVGRLLARNRLRPGIRSGSSKASSARRADLRHRPLDGRRIFLARVGARRFRPAGRAKRSFSFRVAPDNTPPFLKIETPPPGGAILREASVAVTGESEAGRGGDGQRRADRGRRGTVASPQPSTPPTRRNTIVVVATDPAGNETRSERQVSYIARRGNRSSRSIRAHPPASRPCISSPMATSCRSAGRRPPMR